MATGRHVRYEAALPEARRVHDAILAAGEVDWISILWKALAKAARGG